jgi:hypothetical protein
MRQVFARLHETLAAEYVKERQIGPFLSWGGGHVESVTSAVIFRRRDLPAPMDGLGSRLCLQRAG